MSVRILTRHLGKTQTRALAFARKYHAPLNDMKFAIHEVHQFEKHYKTLKTTECDKDTIDAVVDATAKFSMEELAPLNMGADREGCSWINDVR